MTELLITYQRPTALSERELSSWFVARADGLMNTPAILVVEPTGALRGLGAMRVAVEADSRPRRARDAISALLGEMRRLGLRPRVIAAKTREPRLAG